MQLPFFTQNYNRFSYCLNNPLIYTDPSGQSILGDVWNGIKHMWNDMWDGLNDAAQWLDKHGVPSVNVGMTYNNSGQLQAVGNINGMPLFDNESQYEMVSQNAVNAINKARGDYYSQQAYGTNYNQMVMSNIMPVTYSRGSSLLSNWWNSHWTAKMIPDVIYINTGLGFNPGRGPGAGSTGYALPIRGKQAFRLYSYETYSTQWGAHTGVGLNIGYASYVGDSRNFNFENSFGGKSFGWEADYIIGISRAISMPDKNGIRLYSYDIGYGPGFGVSYNDFSITVVKPIW